MNSCVLGVTPLTCGAPVLTTFGVIIGEGEELNIPVFHQVLTALVVMFVRLHALSCQSRKLGIFLLLLFGVSTFIFGTGSEMIFDIIFPSPLTLCYFGPFPSSQCRYNVDSQQSARLTFNWSESSSYSISLPNCSRLPPNSWKGLNAKCYSQLDSCEWVWWVFCSLVGPAVYPVD